MNRWSLIALLAGASLPFAFAPFYFFPLAFLSPAALLYTWLNASTKQAFYRGFIFGIGLFSVGISWVYVSIHIFGQAPIPLALLITAVFIIYLALFLGAQGYLFSKLLPENSAFKLLFVFPCLWVLFEMLRGWLFTGFPWLFLGYSQSNTWLIGYAPLLGIYGLSWICAFFGSGFVYAYQFKKVPHFLILSIASIVVGGLLLSKINWTKPLGHPIQTTLIQGNIEQDLKWQPDQLMKTLKLYSNHTENHWESDLIIWPEAAITLPLNQATPFIKMLGENAKQHHTAIITGIPIVESDKAFNGMISIGEGEGIYHKRHLVPFGEYTPLKPLWQALIQVFNIPMSNFQPGANSQSPLVAKNLLIAPYICYEIAYPLEFLTFLPKAKLLLTITDDSWFGHSIAAKQHLQMAQLRAAETGRFLLFGSNTGITGVINAKGTLIGTLPAFKEASLTTWVQPMEGSTPWIFWKVYPLAAFMMIIFCIALGRSSIKLVTLSRVSVR